MIAKIILANSFAASLAYVQKNDSFEIDRHAVFGSDPHSLGRQMDAWARAGRTKSPVLHASLSATPGEKYTREQWRTAARSWLKGMGLSPDSSQYLIQLHCDQAHEHIHIIANRVMTDGKALSSSHERRRSHAAARAAELEAGMKPFQKTEQFETGKSHDLRMQVDRALKNARGDYQKFKDELAKNAVEVKENRQSTGRLSGLSYITHDGIFKGSSIGKEYSVKGIEKSLAQLAHRRNKEHTPEIQASAVGGAALNAAASAGARAGKRKRKNEMEL